MMRCNMSLEDIIKYAENGLSNEDNMRIKEHLNSCEKCRRYLGVLTFTESYASETSPGPESIKKNVMEAIDVSRYSKDKKRFWLGSAIYKAMPVMKPLLAAAAVFVFILFAASNYQNFLGMINDGNIMSPGVTDSGAVRPGSTDTGVINPVSTASGVRKQVIITLYFGNSNADGVVAETREVEFSEDTPLERVIFEELQRGPETMGLHGTIPKDTKLIGVTTEDGVCTLNLSQEFIDNSPGGSAGETMTLYSIINSLTGLPDIDKVQFLIQGQKEYVYDHVIFDEPFTRREDLIKTLEPQIPVPTPEKDIRKAVELKSENVITALKEKHMDKLAAFVHPIKGVLFSPYSHIDVDKHLVFMPDQIKLLLGDETIYNWGYYDGSGEPIKLTFAQYYDKFIYDKDFANPEEIGYNKILHDGNTLVNISEVYPKGNFIDYHFPNFNPEFVGMDWESLRLVFEEYNGEWYLVCVAHGQWTI